MQKEKKYGWLAFLLIFNIISGIVHLVNGLKEEDDALLENANVINFENEQNDIAELTGYCDEDCSKQHQIYKSVVTNEYYTSLECKDKGTNALLYGKYSIESIEKLSKYLTTAELEKALTQGLTEEEQVKIIVRIVSNEKPKQLIMK